MYLSQMRHFFDCVGGGASPRVSGDDGWRALEIALAAKESAACGRIVELSQ
jgi:predicted dehydrogenase